MAEIYCKRCLHHEELGRPLRAQEICPACGAGVHRRKGRPPRPVTHFGAVLAAIFSLRGIFFLLAFSFIGLVPIGVLATASIIMLFLGSLKLALKAMNMSEGKIEFPEVSAEELFDKSALIPAFAFVIFFVWAPPILIAYAASGAFTLEPGVKEDPPGAVDNALFGKAQGTAKPRPGKHASSAGEEDAINAAGEQLPPDVEKALREAGMDPKALQGMQGIQGMDQKSLEKAMESATPSPHLRAHAELDAPRIGAGLLGIAMFLWAPMALILFLRTSSTLAMLHVPAGLRTMRNDPSGYFVLCLMVLPALAARFAIDVATSTLAFLIGPPLLFVKGVVVLFAWGLCGLYVRQHARAFDMPVDDDDWMPHGTASTGAQPAVVMGKPIG